MPETVNPETHHEKSDVDVRALLWSVVIFIIFGAVTHLLLYMQFNVFRQMFRGATNAPLTAVARPPDAAVPQEPRLQPFLNGNPPNTNTPVTDMEQMRNTEERALRTAGWVDREKGIVRLPIGTAKALAVQRLGVRPSRPQPPGVPPGGYGGAKP
jgi:hypothetical protein